MLNEKGSPSSSVGVTETKGFHDTRSAYIPTLDGWRALAVLGVIGYHCQTNTNHIWNVIASRGNVGVNVFFALSGFLICGKLLDEQRRTATIALKQFYLRRCFRILPALFLYLAILSVLAIAGDIKVNGWEFASTLLYARNYFPTFHGHVLGRFTAHFWSLAVEEHFYMLWPVVMFLAGSKLRRIGWVTLAAALAVFVWRTADSHYGWLIPYGTNVYQKTDTSIDALLWGCLAAIVYPSIQSRLRSAKFGGKLWIPLFALLAAVLFLKNLPAADLIKVILLPALVISTTISPASLLGRILEFPVLRWIGRLSYSLYIWQQLFIFPTTVAGSPFRALQHFPLNIALTFVLAAISYYFVEKPMIRLGRFAWMGHGRRLSTETGGKRVSIPTSTMLPKSAEAGLSTYLPRPFSER